MIAVNGPMVQHCDSIVAESMSTYWNKLGFEALHSGHFTRRSDRIKSYTTSEAVDNLNSIQNKTPFIVDL